MNFDRIIAVRNTKTIYRDGDLCLKVFNEGTSKAGIFNEALNQARAQEAGLNVPSVIQVSVNGGKLMIVSDYVEGAYKGKSRKAGRISCFACVASDADA